MTLFPCSRILSPSPLVHTLSLLAGIRTNFLWGPLLLQSSLPFEDVEGPMDGATKRAGAAASRYLLAERRQERRQPLEKAPRLRHPIGPPSDLQFLRGKLNLLLRCSRVHAPCRPHIRADAGAQLLRLEFPRQRILTEPPPR